MGPPQVPRFISASSSSPRICLPVSASLTLAFILKLFHVLREESKPDDIIVMSQ